MLKELKFHFFFPPPSLCQTNIEPCPECGHLKQKHILCGFCYAKVCKETSAIRRQIQGMEGGPLRAPTMETVILYEGETPSQKDKDKRIVERPRKRPAWFSFWCFSVVRRVFVWQTIRLTFSWLNMYFWNTYILSILLTTKGKERLECCSVSTDVVLIGQRSLEQYMLYFVWQMYDSLTCSCFKLCLTRKNKLLCSVWMSK